MRLLSEAVHCLRHAIEEKGFGLLLATVAVGCGDQLFCLGHSERGEQVRKNWLQRSA